jgi:hypothetical protein
LSSEESNCVTFGTKTLYAFKSVSLVTNNQTLVTYYNVHFKDSELLLASIDSSERGESNGMQHSYQIR